MPVSVTYSQVKTDVERQVVAADRQIDALVYELYGLTDEKIKLVEGERWMLSRSAR